MFVPSNDQIHLLGELGWFDSEIEVHFLEALYDRASTGMLVIKSIVDDSVVSRL